MAELYRDSASVGLAFGVEDAIVSKTEFIRRGEIVATITGNGPVAVPYAITKQDGPFVVKWYYSLEGTDYTRLEEHQVVTPYFTRDELIEWDSDFTQTSAPKTIHLEKLVRHIIETYCGQKFGYREGTITLTGTGNAVMYSSERIINLSGPLNHLPDGYGIHWGASSLNNELNVKIPIQEEALYNGSTPRRFVNGRVYRLTGTFGWLSVPEAVKQAALYLAESFTCNESVWRERYIKSVRAADWRFDYSEETFRSTGSLLADQLLDPYVRLGLTLV